MMDMMTPLPAEVGDQESCVNNETESVIQYFRVRESLVTTLVSQDPESCSNGSGDEGVYNPEREGIEGEWDKLFSNQVGSNSKGKRLSN